MAQKIEFDRGLAEKAGLDWTPSIWIEDELVDRSEMGSSFLENMRKKIDERLKK